MSGSDSVNDSNGDGKGSRGGGKGFGGDGGKGSGGGGKGSGYGTSNFVFKDSPGPAAGRDISFGADVRHAATLALGVIASCDEGRSGTLSAIPAVWTVVEFAEGDYGDEKLRAAARLARARLSSKSSAGYRKQ